MSYQLLFSEVVLTHLALFGPWPAQLLNWVAEHPIRLQAGLRPPFRIARLQFVLGLTRVPCRGPLDLPGLYAQLPELEDGAVDFAFAFPVGTHLAQLEAAARLCQLGAAAGWRVVRLTPRQQVLRGWLRSATAGYALVHLPLHADGQPFWGEAVAAATDTGARQVRALLTRI